MVNKNIVWVFVLFLLAVAVSAETIDKPFIELINNNQKEINAEFILDSEKMQDTGIMSIEFNEVIGKINSYELLTWQLCNKTIYEKQSYTEEVCQPDNLDLKIASVVCYNRTITLKVPKTIQVYDYCKGDKIALNNPKFKIDNVDYDWLDGKFLVDWIPKFKTSVGTIYIDTSKAWWNVSYIYRIPIECTNINTNIPVHINGSGFFVGGGKTKQNVITNCNATPIYLYYNTENDYAIGTQTGKHAFDVIEGNISSYRANDVYGYGGLISYWVAANGDYDDRAKNNNDAISWVDGAYISNKTSISKFGKSVLNLTKDGNDYVLVGTTNIPSGNSQRTFGCWFYIKQLHSDWNSIFYTGDNDASELFGTMINPTGSFYYFHMQSNDWTTTINYTRDIGKWSLLMLGYNGSSTEMFRNATQIDSNAKDPNTATDYVEFGSMPEVANTYDFMGYFSDCFMYSTTITAAARLQIYKNGWNFDGYGNLGGIETQAANPIMREVSILPLSPDTFDNLSCYANSTDEDNLTLVYEYFVYRDGSLEYSDNTTAKNQGDLSLIFLLNATDTNPLEEWNCSVRAYDGSVYSDFMSDSVSIGNSDPTITNPQIYPSTIYNTSLLNCSVVATDLENASLVIEFSWYKNLTNFGYAGFNTSVITQSGVITYTSILVNNTKKPGDNYTCIVRAFDGFTYSDYKNLTRSVSNPPPLPFTFKAIDLETTTGVMLLFLFAFIWLGLLVIGSVFRNFVFVLLSGIFGIFTGIILGQLHHFLFFGMVIVNIFLIFINFMR